MILFDDYDQIQDDIFRYANLSVRFTVRLYNNYGNGQQSKRESYYNEFRRSTSRNLDQSDPATMIKRKMDYFASISIGNGNSNVKGGYAHIMQKHMIPLNFIIQNLVQFIMNNSGWIEKDGKVALKGKINPQIMPLNDYCSQWISFEPIVHINTEERYSRGVRVTINDESTYVDFDYYGFMGFAYAIANLNMYDAAQNILTYYGRPDPGTNRIDFNDDSGYVDIDRVVEEKPKKKQMKFSEQLKKKDE